MKALLFFLLVLPLHLFAQEQTSSEKFWEQLKAHCGNAYEGEIIEGGKAGDGFTGEKLVMHVRSCDTNDIRIPFFVGDNKSRTWVLHIGGTSANQGLANLQMFPADAHTAKILPAASTNIWWFTIDETSLTYNLRRLGTDRLFTVRFDLTKTIETPDAPWGTED